MTNKKIVPLLMGMALVALLALQSCNINKKFVSPQADTTSLYRDHNSADTTTIASVPWKAYFADPQLQALIAEGLQNNTNMQVAQLRIQQAEAGFKMAKAAIYPSLSVGANVQHTQLSTNDGVLDFAYNHQNQLGLTLSAWEIDLWGKLGSQKRAKYASLLNSYEYANLVQTTLVANIAKSYYSLMALDEQLRITKETVVLLKSSCETMMALKEAGTVNGAAVEQSNALLYSAQLVIPTLERQIYEAENVICILLNRKSGVVARDSIGAQVVPMELKYGVAAQMVANRPDVRQAELSFRTAYELTSAARSSLYPSLTLSSGSVGYASSEISNFFRPANIAANVVGGLTQPIFNKRLLRSNLEIAKAQQAEALLNFQNTVLLAGQEVSNILNGFQSSLSKNELRDKQISSYVNAVDFTQQLLLAGEANYTEVLSAERNLLSAQLSKVDDKLEQLNYTVSLYKALGGGVK
jgi:NodT family efflux transporter outer membrane factor (OMF) lipoprotein